MNDEAIYENWKLVRNAKSDDESLAYFKMHTRTLLMRIEEARGK